MKYTEEQINEFADKHIENLLNEPVEDTSNQLNIEVLYQLRGEAQEYSDAIRNANPNSRLFKSTYEDEDAISSKIQRNANAANEMPIGVLKEKVISNIWTARRLHRESIHMGLKEGKQIIESIHQILDTDYVSMGYTITEETSFKK